MLTDSLDVSSGSVAVDLIATSVHLIAHGELLHETVEGSVRSETSI